MKPELNKPRDFLGYLAILPLTNNYKYSADSCIEVNNKKKHTNYLARSSLGKQRLKHREKLLSAWYMRTEAIFEWLGTFYCSVLYQRRHNFYSHPE